MRQGDGVRRAGVRILKWASLVVVLVNVALVWTGAVDAGRAIGIVLAVEAVLWVLIAVLILGAASGYRERRRDGMARREALALAARDVVPAPVLWILRHEASMITTWWLVVRRTRDVPPGAVPFSYGREQLPLFATIASVSVIEIVPIHLLVPWPWLRVVLLVASLYGAVWIIGFYQGLRRRPHYVTDDDLMLRCGPSGIVTVPLAEIASGQRKAAHWSSSGVQFPDEHDVAVSYSGETNVRLELRSGARVTADGVTRPAGAVHFMVDGPVALLSVIDQLRSPETS